MRTVVLGPPPAELADLIACRRALGLDTHDETWDGDYHMAPAAHPYHGYLYEEVADLLRPLTDTLGWFAPRHSIWVSPATSECLTGDYTGRCPRRCS